MTDRQPDIRVCPALRMPAFRGAYVGCKAGATRRGLHYSVLTGCSRLDTAKRERPSRAHPVTGIDPAASDGLGHAVSGLGLYYVQGRGQWDTPCEEKPEKFSSVMRCGERPSSQATVAHHSR